MIGKRYKGKEFHEKPIAVVEHIDGEVWRFNLTPSEIKHIKRCLYQRNIIFPDIYEGKGNNLTQKLMVKFNKFGDLVPRRRTGAQKKADIHICEYPDCQDINTEEHHDNPVSNGGDNKKENIKYYCSKHHDLIEMEHALWRKELEVVKLKERIKNLKDEKTIITL